MRKKIILIVVLFLIFALLTVANLFFLVKLRGVTARTAAQGKVELIIGAPEEEEEEAPPPAPAAAPGGGAGGVSYSFELEPELIKVMAKQGETFKTSFKVKNIGSQQDFKLFISDSLKQFVSLSETKFSLASKEEKTIFISFLTAPESVPDVYTGNITVQGKLAKFLPVIFELKSAKVFFDLSLNIPSKYKEVFPGNDILLEIILFNLGDKKDLDIDMTYFVKDFSGNTIVNETDSITLETQLSYTRKLKLPPDISEGQYAAVVYGVYNQSVVTASDTFYVVKVELPKIFRNIYFIISILLLLIILFAIVLLLEYERKKLRNVLKVQRKELSQISSKISKKAIKAQEKSDFKGRLYKQLNALEQAYKGKYITEESYDKGKERIKRLLRKLE